MRKEDLCRKKVKAENDISEKNAAMKAKNKLERDKFEDSV